MQPVFVNIAFTLKNIWFNELYKNPSNLEFENSCFIGNLNKNLKAGLLKMYFYILNVFI